MARLQSVLRPRRFIECCARELYIGLKRPSNGFPLACSFAYTKASGAPRFRRCSSMDSYEGCDGKILPGMRHGATCKLRSSPLASPLCTFEGDEIIPPHSTGGAVDIEIIDKTGRPLDFGMELSDWDVVSPELCATEFNSLPDAVMRNRKLLVETLAAEGFINYPREWWHFSYGDQYWAFATGSAKALYGTVQE